MNNSGYTIKQIADLIGVSKEAIRKVIKQHNIKYEYTEKNRQYYSYNDTVKIVLFMRDDFDLSLLDLVVDTPQTTNQNFDNSPTKTANQPQTIEADEDPHQVDPKEKPQTNTANSQTNTDNQPTTENQVIEILRQTIDTLKNQLIEKDKQIENLNKNIERLTFLLNNEQQNHIKAITELTEEHQQQKKKGFFSRLFNKNS
jgi:DNA-binding transcriptional MerR regulator